jgi:hypothetical protein
VIEGASVSLEDKPVCDQSNSICSSHMSCKHGKRGDRKPPEGHAEKLSGGKMEPTQGSQSYQDGGSEEG